MKSFVIIGGILAMVGILFAAEEVKNGEDKDSVYLFSYFKGNGDGLHFAYSPNGLRWTAVKNDAIFLTPEIGSKLMRDPSICRGPDGMFHMVWTTGWWDKGIGLAHSKDLVNWSQQEFIEVMKHEPEARNCWAPEIFYDVATETYLIYWATTIPGRFPETENPKDDNNNRIYYVTTKDFKTFSETTLFFDPGFNVIDAFIARDEANSRYVMFIKNETKVPKPKKDIAMIFSEQAAGPWGPVSEPITGKYWAEGPAAIQINGKWLVYFDKYTEHRYGAVISEDLREWRDISGRVEFPDGMRHGTAFEVSRAIAEGLTK